MRNAAVDLPLAKAADVRRAVIRLAHRLRTERPRDGLSVNKLGVLGHLHRHGPTTPGEIADVERRQPQSLTRLLAELEAAGLIRKTPSEQDRRQVMLEITATGRQALNADMAGRDAWLAAALAPLSEIEREVLRLAAPLMERIAEVDVGEAPGGKSKRGSA